jgi:hypothetical protein
MPMTKEQVREWCVELAEQVNSDPALLSAFVNAYDLKEKEEDVNK